jgi:hypothetical protein
MGASMADDYLPVKMGFKLGSLTPAQIQSLLDEITVELSDPTSQISRETDELGLAVQSLEVEEPPAFVLEAFVIAMAIKFAGGAAASGGALFFKKVVQPRIMRKKADGIGDQIDLDNPDGDD